VEIPSVSLSAREFLGELRGLVGLGAVFLLTGLQATGIEFLLRTILLHQTDLATVGQFLAAAALSHVYVNFILQAMGMDYLPRLTRVKDDPVACNRLVNEQSEVALLLAGAGIVALTVLAPLLIPLLYSGRFAAAIEVFRWQCLGVLLKVASWPIGFVLIAKGMRTTFLVTETSTYLFYLISFYVLSTAFGLLGAALAFAVMYAFHLTLILGVVRRATGFAWSAGSRSVLLGTGAAYAAALACDAWVPRPWSALAGGVVVAATAAWAYRQLCRRLDLPLARLVVERLARVARSAAHGGGNPSR
jgi:PST family polysaccharide transporter